MDIDAYLDRLGLVREDVTPPDRAALARLQRAHVTAVPFETLAVTGPPHRPGDGEGVVLDVGHLFEKVVERERGGFCYELNGLFGSLLSELGFDAHRAPARMLGEEGEGAAVPANHHVNVVHLEQPYLVDVGMGTPTMRRPTPLDGTPVTDEVGVAWRVTPRDRPDVDHLVRYRGPGEDGWQDRYVFREAAVELSYFRATCDYLETAPESPFTGDPVVTLATPDGHVRLDSEELTRTADGEESTEPVAPAEWPTVAREVFGLAVGG